MLRALRLGRSHLSSQANLRNVLNWTFRFLDVRGGSRVPSSTLNILPELCIECMCGDWVLSGAFAIADPYVDGTKTLAKTVTEQQWWGTEEREEADIYAIVELVQQAVPEVMSARMLCGTNCQNSGKHLGILFIMLDHQQLFNGVADELSDLFTLANPIGEQLATDACEGVRSCICGGTIDYGWHIGNFLPYLEDPLPENATDVLSMLADVVPKIMSNSNGICSGQCPAAYTKMEQVLITILEGPIESALENKVEVPIAHLMDAAETTFDCVCGGTVNYSRPFLIAKEYVDEDFNETNATVGMLADVLPKIFDPSGLCGGTCPQMASEYAHVGTKMVVEYLIAAGELPPAFAATQAEEAAELAPYCVCGGLDWSEIVATVRPYANGELALETWDQGGQMVAEMIGCSKMCAGTLGMAQFRPFRDF